MNQQQNSSDKIFNLSVHSDFTVLIPWWYNYFLDKKNTNILIPLEQYYKFQCNHKLIFSTETTSIHRGQVFSVTFNNIWKWWIYFYRKKYIIELFSHLQEFSFIIWIILCCSYHYKLAVGIYIHLVKTTHHMKVIWGRDISPYVWEVLIILNNRYLYNSDKYPFQFWLILIYWRPQSWTSWWCQ